MYNINALYRHDGALPESALDDERLIHFDDCQNVYCSDYCQVRGWTHKIDKKQWVENDKWLLIVVGDIIFRRAYHKNSDSPSMAEIQVSIEQGRSLSEKYQGNFWIIYFNKITNVLEIISDPLAIIPLYLYSKDNLHKISTDLRVFKKNRINKQVVLEHLLFNQPLTTNTLIEGVNRLKPGWHYLLKDGEIRANQSYDMKKLIFNSNTDKLLIDELIEDFNYSVVSLSNKYGKNLVSLTGGYDSRSVVSTLIKEGVDFSSFSFGKYGGPNTKSPLIVKEKLGIDYAPIYLEKDYEEKYVYYAHEAIDWSDGLSIFERANYMFVADKLSEISDFYLSGLIGGELFGPMTMFAPFCSKLYVETFYYGRIFNAEQTAHEIGLSEYLSGIEPEIIYSLEQTVKSYQNEIAQLKNSDLGYMYWYYDFINNGFRSYYGSQVHTERKYISNRLPFYTLDILERLMLSDHKIAYKRPFRSNPIYKTNNRILQAKIIQHNCPELSKLYTDRGFAPVELLSARGKVTSAVKYLINKNKRKKSNPEFTSNMWSMLFYDVLLKNKINFDHTIFNNENIYRFLNEYNASKYNQTFNWLLSVAIWLSK